MLRRGTQIGHAQLVGIMGRKHRREDGDEQDAQQNRHAQTDLEVQLAVHGQRSFLVRGSMSRLMPSAIRLNTTTQTPMNRKQVCSMGKSLALTES